MPITVREMRVLETNCIGLGIPLRMLMETAGANVARVVEERISPKDADNIVIMIGKGGNGGDGVVAARYLSSRGYNVTILPAYPLELIEHPDTKANLEIVKRLESVKIAKPGDESILKDADIIIDGLLGTGVKGELRDPIKSFVEEANTSKAKLKIAIDTPTGLNPDTGEVHGVAFKADITVTFHDVKPGLLKRRDLVGEIIVANIGIPREALLYVGPGDYIHLIPQKPRDAHKGVGGRIVVIGGSKYYTGAPALVGMAALATGADLAFIIVPETVRNIVASYSPELITYPVRGEWLKPEHVDEILNYITRAKAHVVALGNGIGAEPETIEFVRELIPKLIEKNILVVMDADALKAVRYGMDKFSWKAILTPHRGEFKKITALDLTGNPHKDYKIVVEASKKLEATILLKAPIDIIAYGDRYKFNKTGNPGMSIGGTGDALVGIVSALYAKSRDPFIAASVGAYLCGLAGDYAMKIEDTIPSPMNIIRVLPRILNNILDIHTKLY